MSCHFLEDGKPSTLTRQLGPGISFRLSQALPNQSSSVDDASFQPLHRALAARVRGPDLLPQLLDDGQQLGVFALGHLAAPSPLGIAERRWPIITQQLSVL